MPFNPDSHDQLADAINRLVARGEHHAFLHRLRQEYDGAFDELLAMMQEVNDEPGDEE